MNRIILDARISGTTTGRYVDKLIEYLHRLNPSEKIIVLTRSERVEYLKQIAPTFEVIESNYPDFSTGEQLGLKKQIESLHPDLVHFPMVQQPIFYRGKVATSMLDLTTLQFRNPAKNPVVFTAKQQVYKQVNRIAAKKSTHIITISDYVRDQLITIYKLSPNKITTTYCAADEITELSEPIKHLSVNSFIMYTGRPLPHKNLERLLEAFVEIRKVHPELKLVLAGKKDALFERHEQIAIKLGLNHSQLSISNSQFSDKENHNHDPGQRLNSSSEGNAVVFTGFVTEGQLRWLYENCQAYVFPSLSEGFGLPGLEAMVHGAPVVSSNATCLPEIYGDAAHYFDPLDVSDMSRKICDVLENKKLRESLVKKGNAQAKKYSWQRMAKQTLEIYKKALAD